jgi:penicillin-binding protein 2
VQIQPVRRYPHGRLASHLLGYAGEVTDQELDSLSASGYRLGDLIGRTGIERRYEEIQRGRDGAEYVVVNAMGKRVSTLTEEPPRPPVGGHDIVLTLISRCRTRWSRRWREWSAALRWRSIRATARFSAW